ncbi:MAG TPA: fluoride efflux transporter CrcB [Alphaproteobacteria bacterium]|nr:fluoride efflux transporter CrcB [Alphaproteobacteria bacterium]
MTPVLAVALGGALGSVARYLVVAQMARWLGPAFPWGTLAVNVIGGLAIGLMAEAMALKWPVSPETRLFLITGILGGFTTFSAFSLEVVALVERSAFGAALAYVVASVVLSVGAVFAGFALVRGAVG